VERKIAKPRNKKTSMENQIENEFRKQASKILLRNFSMLFAEDRKQCFFHDTLSLITSQLQVSVLLAFAFC
jgi:hypothetical protein